MSLTHDEILATPESLEKTARYLAERQRDIVGMFNGPFERILFLGCGSSYCLAKSAARMMMMHARKSAAAFAAGDVLLHPDRYADVFHHALVVTLSRSGSTSEVVYALQAMRERSSFRTMTINCVENSPLSKMGDLSLDMPWAFDASVCQTRCVSCLFHAASTLAALAGKDTTIPASLESAVRMLPAFIRNNEQTARDLAARMWTNAVVLADADLAGLGEEGALAYREICQLPGAFWNVLDCRHGPMVLFDRNTLVVLQLHTGNELELGLVRHILQKGSHVVLVSDAAVRVDGTVNIVTGLEGGHTGRGLPFIVLNQLIALRKSEVTGANPDKPEGLSAWIQL